MHRWLIGLFLIVGIAAAAPAAIEGSGEELQSEGELTSPNLRKETTYKMTIGEQVFRIPFMTRLFTPFLNGQTIHAFGKIKEKPSRIVFNFHKGSDNVADMPLHFAINFDENNTLSYNTFLNGEWADPEKIDNPFKAGGDFDLRVRIIDETYHVFANRKDVGKFKIRQSIDGVDHVSIRGDLANLRLFHYGGFIFGNPYFALTPLVPGTRMDMSGVPTGKRFVVNLYRENQEHALQLSVRLDEGVIVRNAMVDHMWGKEERDGALTIAKGELFDLLIINEEISLQIFVNGKRFCSFAHRGKPSDFKTLEVAGDVELHTVKINAVTANTTSRPSV